MKLSFLDKGWEQMVQEDINREKRTGPCLHEQIDRGADEWTGYLFFKRFKDVKNQ